MGEAKDEYIEQLESQSNIFGTTICQAGTGIENERKTTEENQSAIDNGIGGLYVYTVCKLLTQFE